MHNAKCKINSSLYILHYTLVIALNGGGERDRTDDLLRARQALSQLSYTPHSMSEKLKVKNE